jgi:hypothetical protein
MSSCSPTGGPSCSPAAPGLTLERSEAASGGLLADLRSDVGMEWVPESMWLSYLQLDAAAGDLDYDLAVSQEVGDEPSVTDAGVGPASVVPIRPPQPARPWWPIALGGLVGLAALVGAVRRVGTAS